VVERRVDFFVYMLRCRDGSYYVGSARGSLEKRISEHQEGVYGGYTARRRPVELVYSDWFASVTDAVAAERKLKGWSRAKKEALIHGDWDRIKSLARRGAAPSSFETGSGEPSSG